MRKKILSVLILMSVGQAFAQDNLINALANNQGKNVQKYYQIKPVFAIGVTDVKDQGHSGTCWSYAGSSFLESEMMKKKKQPVDLAEIYTARKTYLEKAINYLRMHGALTWGDGGELHDVINIYRKYGAVPQSAYSGLINGATKNDFKEMQKDLESYLKEIVTSEKVPANWKEVFEQKMDSYIGAVPKTFMYNGKMYTPETFAKEVVGLEDEKYIEMLSVENKPKYQNVFMAVPDNWSFDYAFNVNMEDFITTIDYALSKGYTVGWAADVSEKSFSWRNGLALVPEKDYKDLSEAEQKEYFHTYWNEKEITPAMRQKAFDNYENTDDHAMQIVGLAKDQKGREYYIVKNSWGTSNDNKGYLYVSKNYVRYKTMAILVNQKGTPKSLLKKFKKASFVS
ncbi:MULTISPECIES: aminopeptidase C [unclassified Capnocytophaga]|uniref:aminopeptidase C n=1 Tax=unclassified Capnocytophaga TaxID=2640652 RepID=UPI000202D6BB|nr:MULTISPECIES: C1 family peptidase [unclassified Capnocytophaga]EGD33851.1 aminopeptidase C (bleomycin hydrolase) [Capnocytophaga sp. oral taxon 338 str. F0234]MEB3004971.1 C1 family peptidase [Capnocytophaga sp. G2]